MIIARTLRRLALSAILLTLLLGGPLSLAQDAGYRIDWWTVDGGGGVSSGSGYLLHGSAGQPDAGRLTSADNAYTLEGGFWSGAGPALNQRVYLPLAVK